jgi:hypothetical protein
MRVCIDAWGADPVVTDLATFFEVNAMDAEERAEILASLEAGETYFGGGGAMADWSLTPIPRP